MCVVVVEVSADCLFFVCFLLIACAVYVHDSHVVCGVWCVVCARMHSHPNIIDAIEEFGGDQERHDGVAHQQEQLHEEGPFVDLVPKRVKCGIVFSFQFVLMLCFDALF